MNRWTRLWSEVAVWCQYNQWLMFMDPIEYKNPITNKKLYVCLSAWSTLPYNLYGWYNMVCIKKAESFVMRTNQPVFFVDDNVLAEKLELNFIQTNFLWLLYINIDIFSIYVCISYVFSIIPCELFLLLF